MKKLLVENKAVTPSQTVTEFGFGQIGKTTPEWATWVFRIVLYSATIVNLALTIFTDIPEDVRLRIGMYSLQIVTFVHAISKMFGLNLKDD